MRRAALRKAMPHDIEYPVEAECVQHEEHGKRQVQQQRIEQRNIQPPGRQRQRHRHEACLETERVTDPHPHRPAPAEPVLQCFVDMVVCHVASHRARRKDDCRHAEVQHVHAEAVRHQRHQDDQGKDFKQDGVDNAPQQGIDDKLDRKRKGTAIIEKRRKSGARACSTRINQNRVETGVTNSNICFILSPLQVC